MEGLNESGRPRNKMAWKHHRVDQEEHGRDWTGNGRQIWRKVVAESSKGSFNLNSGYVTEEGENAGI